MGKQWQGKAIPEHLVLPIPEFRELWQDRVDAGAAELAASSIAVVGLARNCAAPLHANLSRLQAVTDAASEWRLHIETNDNQDATDQVLADFCREHSRATFTSQRLGHRQFGAEFAGPRTVAMAAHRSTCQQWVREFAADSRYVIAIDFDAWGGWVHEGLLNGLGWLALTPQAFGMASVSLFEWNFANGRQWAHYDCWALRLNSTWDDYTAGQGGWKYGWLPPVGSPPVPVCSAFGGLAVYRTADYLAGTYDGTDCEHVPFHASIAALTGRTFFLNPSQRCIMQWLPEATDGGQHGND
jgi:hypothetical protein